MSDLDKLEKRLKDDLGIVDLPPVEPLPPFYESCVDLKQLKYDGDYIISIRGGNLQDFHEAELMERTMIFDFNGSFETKRWLTRQRSE